MRRMLIPLTGLMLSSVLGCTCVRGKCDCEFYPTLGCDVYHVRVYGLKGAGDVAPLGHAAAAETLHTPPAPLTPEPIKEMPRVASDKEEEQEQPQQLPEQQQQ
jgi:hypothetical protein